MGSRIAGSEIFPAGSIPIYLKLYVVVSITGNASSNKAACKPNSNSFLGN